MDRFIYYYYNLQFISACNFPYNLFYLIMPSGFLVFTTKLSFPPVWIFPKAVFGMQNPFLSNRGDDFLVQCSDVD